MITPTNDRKLLSSGSMSSVKFGITKNPAKIIRLLRDSVYEDKELATIREVYCNAQDSHNRAGKHDVAPRVGIPSLLESSFTVRDWGSGLSEDEVNHHACVYGESSKDETNAEVGFMGIGFKAPFAYTDSFTVTSWWGCTKSVYQAVIDDSDCGLCSKMYEGARHEHLTAYLAEHSPPEMEARVLPDAEQDDGWVDLWWLFDVQDITVKPFVDMQGRYLTWCALHQEDASEDGFRLWMVRRAIERFREWAVQKYPDHETGLEVKVPVSPNDIDIFKMKAREFFAYSDPRPQINLQVPYHEPQYSYKHGFFSTSRTHRDYGKWVVVMGGVPYRLDLNRIEKELRDAGLFESICNLHGGLKCEIGEVSPSASREGLEYRPKTRQGLVVKFKKLIHEAFAEIRAVRTDDSLSAWSKRLKYQKFFSTTGLRRNSFWMKEAPGKIAILPKEKYQEVDGEKVVVHSLSMTEPTRLHRQRPVMKPVHEITVSQETVIIYRDKNLGLPDLSRYHYMVGSSKPAEEGLEELKGYLEKAGATGVKILMLSDVQTAKPKTPRYSDADKNKHRVSLFRLKDNFPGAVNTLSKNWDIVEHVPTKDDVYVIINRFVPVDSTSSWYRKLRDDQKLLSSLKGSPYKMPTIWGLKTTQKKPVSPSDVKGTPYSDWVQGEIDKLLKGNTEVKSLLEYRKTFSLKMGNFYVSYTSNGASIMRSLSEARKRAESILGEKHDVTVLLRAKEEARTQLSTSGYSGSVLKTLEGRLNVPSPHSERFRKVKTAYPLMFSYGGLNLLSASENTGPHWATYIKAMDALTDSEDS